uniref:Conotoxin superfamily S n=1 Tax=Conus ermineus TaxID=55423 RepID=A0A346CIT2_CONER|nr:conotoxin precursor superfamily S [Conus ermineus]
MMSKMGAMFVLLLLFTLASSQQEGDVQARKTHLKSNFYRTLPRNVMVCTGTCSQSSGCDGTCNCTHSTNCYCKRKARPSPGCWCICEM